MANAEALLRKSFEREKVIRTLTLVIWCIVLIRYAILLSGLRARVTRYDFSLYYTSALALRSGIDPYYSNLEKLGGPLGLELPDPFTSNYTPLFLVAFEPLTELPIETAYWIWFAVSICSMTAALALLIGGYEIGGMAAWMVVGLFLLFPGVTTHFQFAQSQFVLLLTLVVMLQGLNHDREKLAGAALAIAIMFKVFPIVMVGFLVSRRRWRVIGWAVVTVVALAVLLLPQFGARDWLQFFKNTGKDPYVLSYNNMAPAAFFSRLYWHFFTVNSSDLIRHLIIAGFDLVVAAITFYVSAHDQVSPDLGFSLWLIAMLLLSPLVWIHYLPLLVIPAVQVAWLWRLGHRLPVGAPAMFLGFAIIFVFAPLTELLPHHGIGELLAEYGGAALLLIYYSEYRLARQFTVVELSEIG